MRNHTAEQAARAQRTVETSGTTGRRRALIDLLRSAADRVRAFFDDRGDPPSSWGGLAP